MKRIDDNLKDDVIFGTSDKDEWLKNHTLSVEQVRQLILNKYERAKQNHEKLTKLKKLVKSF